MNRRILPFAVALLVAACNLTTDPTSPTNDAAASAKPDVVATSLNQGAAPIRIYQQNVYPGFDIDAVIDGITSGDPDRFVGALAQGLATLDATNWPERAARMAQEIEAQNPDVVSLNEMVTIERKGLGYIGLPIADGRVDFLAVFGAELAKRNLAYKLVDSLPLTFAPVDIGAAFGIAPAGTIFATYYDRDVLFVRRNVEVANVVADTFAVGQVEVVRQIRGSITADLTLRGETWHFVASHPEPSWPANGQVTHVQEILASAGDAARPTVIAGDLNLQPSSAEHEQLTSAGFVDLLEQQFGSSAAGNTCCQSDPALRNASPTLVKRIDYVLVRPADGYTVGPMGIQVFGDDASERTASGMWPSDHAGLFAMLVLQRMRP